MSTNDSGHQRPLSGGDNRRNRHRQKGRVPRTLTKHQLSGLRRQQFGSRSESLDQLELTREEEEIARAAEPPTDAMLLSALDGLLAELVVYRDMIMPSEWMPIVWRDDLGPLFDCMMQTKTVQA